MSLNTNGWDYGYHVKLSDINSFISSQSTTNLKLINEINGNQDGITGIVIKNVTKTFDTNISDQTSKVDNFICAVCKELILQIPMYKDYSGDMPENNTANATGTIINYFRTLLSTFLKNVHKKSVVREVKERQYLITKPDLEHNFDEVFKTEQIEKDLIRKRLETYLAYYHTFDVYNVTTYTAGQKPNENPFTAILGKTEAEISLLTRTFVSALVPVHYVDKAVVFADDGADYSTTKLKNLSKYTFLIGGNSSTAPINFKLEYKFYKKETETKLKIIEKNGFGILTEVDLNTNEINVKKHLNLNWVSSTFDTINSLESAFLGSSSSPEFDLPIKEITFNDIFIKSIYQYINKAFIPATDQSKFFYGDNYYRYYYAFAQFNSIINESIKANKSFNFISEVKLAIEALIPIAKEKLTAEENIMAQNAIDSILNEKDDELIKYFEIIFRTVNKEDFKKKYLNNLNAEAQELFFKAFNEIWKKEFPHYWLFPTITRYAVMDSVTGFNDLKESVLSICCMIKGNKNYNPATPDLNAIPSGANSALVIERSVFGEHMVMPQIVKGIIENGKGNEFEPKSNYSFHNKEKLVLKYKDYRKANSYGFFHFMDYINLAGSWLHSQGSFGPNQGTISIEEDHITFRAKDVYYMYSVENYPNITQNYRINIKKTKDDDLKVNAQLEDIDMKYFHTDFLILAWSLFLKNTRYTKENAIYNPKDGHDRLSYYLAKYILTDDERNIIIQELIHNMDDLNNRRRQRIQELNQQEVDRLARLEQERLENERRLADAQRQIEEEERLRLQEQQRVAEEQEALNALRIQEEEARKKQEAIEKLNTLIKLVQEKYRSIEQLKRLDFLREIKIKKLEKQTQDEESRRVKIENETKESLKRKKALEKYVKENSIFYNVDGETYTMSEDESKEFLNRTWSADFNANAMDALRESSKGKDPLKPENDPMLQKLGREGGKTFDRIDDKKQSLVAATYERSKIIRKITANNCLNMHYTKKKS